MEKIKAMIISLGGSPEPIIKSIIYYEPEFISFFVSQQTLELTCDIRKNVTEKIQNYNYNSETTVAEDANDLLHCYEKAEEAVQRVIKRSYKNDEVVVDYTGGTKNMSVALGLASILHGFSFNYVGGDIRTKNGTGIVVSGTEKIIHSINPWDFLAKDDFIRFCEFFDRYQFYSAKAILENILKKTTKYKLIYEQLSILVDAYAKWDQFKHKEAFRTFKKLNMTYLKEFKEYNLSDLTNHIEQNKCFLESFSEEKPPTYNHILDLFGNADRRYEEGKIDDAILRLYRVSEMIAQYQLKKIYNIDNSRVDENDIPDDLKEDFVRKYKDPEINKLKLPLFASYILLNKLGDEYGKNFFHHEQEFKRIMVSRNFSYLAHGFESSREETYKQFKEIILNYSLIDINNVPKFPKITQILKVK